MAAKDPNRLFDLLDAMKESMESLIEDAQTLVQESASFTGEISKVMKQQLVNYFIPGMQKMITDPNTPGSIFGLQRFLGSVPLAMTREKPEGEDPLEGICDEVLVSKLLGVKKEENDRIVAQSLSLFDTLGIEADRRGEMDLVAKSEEITFFVTPISDKMRLFDQSISKYLYRGILEKKGRAVSLRPIPLALYLIAEWLRNKNSENLKEVIKVI